MKCGTSLDIWNDDCDMQIIYNITYINSCIYIYIGNSGKYHLWYLCIRIIGVCTIGPKYAIVKCEMWNVKCKIFIHNIGMQVYIPKSLQIEMKHQSGGFIYNI